MRIQSIAFTDAGVQITYLEDRDVHETGCMDWTVRDIPHSLVPQDMLTDLQEDVRAIVDHVSVLNRNPRFDDGQAEAPA